MICARCDTTIGVALFRAVLRRVTGRGWFRSEPSPFCDACAATVAGLLAPGKLERVP